VNDQKTTRVLEVQLTEPELDARRKTLSELCVELTRTEERLASAKSTVKRLNEARTTQTKVLESGNELRSVQCTIRLDGKRIRVVRDDTGDTVEDRPATYEERQLTLGDEEAEADDLDDATDGDPKVTVFVPEPAERKPRNTAKQGPAKRGKRGRK
jgi:hypothetical protein